MKHKTAIEKCIQMLADNPASGLADEFVAKARQELRALLALAQGVAKAEHLMFEPCDVHPMTYAVAGLSRLRRLGVLPEKKP